MQMQLVTCIEKINNNDGVTCGARPDHLRNKEVVISEMDKKGEIKTHWDKVYID
jgi:hypothetical protein